MKLFLLFAIGKVLVSFGAKRVFYFPEENKVILKDSAWVKTEEAFLKADSIVYFLKPKILKAFYNSILITSNDTFFGDSLYYDVKRKQGFAFQGYTFDEKGKLWGQETFKDSTGIYVYRGFYTTCDSTPPHYYFQAKYMKIVKNEMVIAKPVVLKIHNVPILAVPFWMFPIKKKRKSGFLVPKFGYNSSSGKYIRNLSYYLVFNNYADMTFSLDMVENVGIRAGIELVYNVYKRLNGRIFYTRAENLYPRRGEWSIKFNHFQRLPYNFVLSAQADYVSSYDYFNQYSENVIEWLKREMQSYLTLQRAGKLPVIITINDRYRPATEHRESLLPLFQTSFPSIGPMNLRGNFSFKREVIKDSGEVVIRPGGAGNFSASYSFNLFHYLRNSFALNTAVNILPIDSGLEKFGIQKSLRLIYSFATTLYGFSLFGLPFLNVRRFIHVLEPSLSFGYTPEIENRQFYYQYGSFYAPGKSLGWKVNNTFFAKTDSGKVMLFNLSFSSSYDFAQKKWSDIPFSFSLSDRLPVKIRGSGKLIRDSLKIQDVSIVASTRFRLLLPRTSFISDSGEIKNYLSISLSYQVFNSGDFKSEVLGVSTDFRATPTITGNFQLSRDLKNGRTLSYSLNLKKDLHCWELDFGYRKYGELWDYSFKLFIKKIPEIKLDKGLIRNLMP